jgi:hypothetical protein
MSQSIVLAQRLIQVCKRELPHTRESLDEGNLEDFGQIFFQFQKLVYGIDEMQLAGLRLVLFTHS